MFTGVSGLYGEHGAANIVAVQRRTRRCRVTLLWIEWNGNIGTDILSNSRLMQINFQDVDQSSGIDLYYLSLQ
jgi:hypothetical protein